MSQQAATDEDSRLAALMRAAQDGDERAYKTVLRACVPHAAAIARRHGVPPDAVDDVVQETLLTIHRALPTYDPARPFHPWLRAIASRRAIDALRRHGRKGAREVHDDIAYLNHAEDPPDFAGSETGRAEAGRLRAAISTLPPRQREAVELLGLNEKTLAEAAQDTGSTKVALKVNFFRAMKSLRARLGSNADV